MAIILAEITKTGIVVFIVIGVGLVAWGITALVRYFNRRNKNKA